MKTVCSAIMIIFFLSFRINVIYAQTGTTAEKLIKALNAKDCTTAKILVGSVENIDYRDTHGGSFLMHASLNGCFNVVKIL